MIPADPTDSYQVNNIPSWWFEDAQRIPTDGEEEDSALSDDNGLEFTPPFFRAESPVVPNPDLSYEVVSRPPTPPPVNQNPPFPPPYENCNFYQFRDVEDARNYYRHLNNHENCWVAIPSTFLHRIVENPSNPPRRYRRARRRAYKTVKYSNETVTVSADTKFIDGSSKEQLTQISSEIVKNLGAGGMRKAKNFTLQITTNATYPLWWVLVYVPQGTKPSQITFGSPDVPTSIYEPNQNVIMSGVVGPGSNQQTWRTRLARNLNSGDSIMICFSSPYVQQIWALPDAFALNCTLNYAISF